MRYLLFSDDDEATPESGRDRISEVGLNIFIAKILKSLRQLRR
jgi:hypothetical protein